MQGLPQEVVSWVVILDGGELGGESDMSEW